MKYDQTQYHWQLLAAEADAVKCTKYESEDLLQNACVMWHNHFFRDRSMLFAIPNGGERHIAEALKFVATGTKAGASDLILLEPMARTSYFIELKNRKNYIDPEQDKFRLDVEKLGFFYYMANTFHQFAYLILWLMDVPGKDYKKYLS